MPFYYYIFLLVAISIITVSILFFKSLKKNTFELLFNEGLKQENIGHFHEAIIIYERVLNQLSKSNSKRKFKAKIVDKIKVLHTVIEYENYFRTKRY